MYTGVLCERVGLAEKMSSLEGVDCIYSYEYPFSKAGKKGKKWIQLLPHVFRADTFSEADSLADGVLVRNYDELMYIISLDYRGEIVSDAGLYTMNSASAGSLFKDGVTRTVYPLELNYREMLRRGYADRSELIIYGRSALMISANCVYKDSTKKCAGRQGRKERPEETDTQFYVNITDRKRTVFPVLCDCRYCYNVIYNSVPTSLHKAMDKVFELSPCAVRLDFTNEDIDTAKKVVKYYVNLIRNREGAENSGEQGHKPVAVPKELESFTYGHFKNGVE